MELSPALAEIELLRAREDPLARCLITWLYENADPATGRVVCTAGEALAGLTAVHLRDIPGPLSPYLPHSGRHLTSLLDPDYRTVLAVAGIEWHRPYGQVNGRRLWTFTMDPLL